MEKLIEKAIMTKLPSRTSISIPSSANFGLEIENNDFNNQDEWDDAERIIKNIDSRLCVHDDRSLSYIDDNGKVKLGLEVSTPILQNKKADIKLLKKLSKTLKYINPKYNISSFQVNLDDNLNFEERLELLKMYAYYEKVIMRFCRGNDKELRQCTGIYAYYIYYELLSELQSEKSIEEKIQTFTERKMFGINLKNKQKRIIEFRAPNGCNDLELWLNYINTFYYLVDAVSKKKYDKELIDFNFSKEHKTFDDEYLYNYRCFSIHEKLAIDFVNTIFDNELDKLYFLKQYIGKDEEYTKVLIK